METVFYTSHFERATNHTLFSGPLGLVEGVAATRGGGKEGAAATRISIHVSCLSHKKINKNWLNKITSKKAAIEFDARLSVLHLIVKVEL